MSSTVRSFRSASLAFSLILVTACTALAPNIASAQAPPPNPLPGQIGDVTVSTFAGLQDTIVAKAYRFSYSYNPQTMQVTITETFDSVVLATTKMVNFMMGGAFIPMYTGMQDAKFTLLKGASYRIKFFKEVPDPNNPGFIVLQAHDPTNMPMVTP